ncbi:uncharacterized protein AB9X84_026010 [Acanthopagrus schlegelii]
MSIRVEVTGGNKTEQDVTRLVSNVFGCHNSIGFTDFCQGDRQLQVEVVTCEEKMNIRNTTCDVLLQLSHAVSVCELQRAGASALQQAGDGQIQARIMGKVERVARDLCEGVETSGGGFVRCTSTSPLDDICQANKHSELTCSLIEPNSSPTTQSNTKTCSRQFFAMKINIHSDSVKVNVLKSLLSAVKVASVCQTSGSMCQDSGILKRYRVNLTENKQFSTL